MKIFPLLDCRLIASILTGVQTALCVDMVNSLTYISTGTYDCVVISPSFYLLVHAGECGLSIFMIAAVVLAILGIKRFSTSNRLDKDDYGEEDKY